MSHSVGVAMAGGNPLLGRNDHDFYATPADCTLSVLPRLPLRGPVHEFACGDGAIAKLIAERGIEVIGTDLHFRGYGEGGHDVLAMKELVADEMMSNPPFNIAPRIIATVMPLKPRLLVLLLKSSFWHAKTRMPLFRKYPPSAVYALSWRPDFASLGAPTLELSWMVWDRDHVGGTVYDVLERPPGHVPVVKRRKKPKPEEAATEVEIPAVAAPAKARRPRRAKLEMADLFEAA